MRLVQGAHGANRMYLKARSEQSDCKSHAQVRLFHVVITSDGCTGFPLSCVHGRLVSQAQTVVFFGGDHVYDVNAPANVKLAQTPSWLLDILSQKFPSANVAM